MIRVVIDTSALISLEVVEIMEKLFEIAEVIIPQAVEEEIIKLGRFRDEEGLAARRIAKFIEKKRIKVRRVKSGEKVARILSRNVNAGEAECFVCCLEQNVRTLIIDDVDAAYDLESISIASGIKLKLSAAVLVELYRKKLLSKKELRRKIRKLIKTRRWESNALETLCKKYLNQ